MPTVGQRPSNAEEGRPDLPRGIVAFLFTDVEGSTRLLHELGEAYTRVLLDQRAIMRSSFERWRGIEVDTQGDSFFVAFARTSDAIACALEAQRGLEAHDWPGGNRVRVRMAVHTGAAEVAGSGYVGIEVHRAARIMAAGHGGQILVSASASAAGTDDLPEGASLVELGEYRLRDLTIPERLFQVAGTDLAADFPPLRTLDYRPSNLPVPASAFIGREHELQEIGELLRADPIRLVTLTGPGGSGKTRLALRAAADHLERVAEGVFFVDLAPIREVESALAAIGQVIGVTQTREQPLLQTLKTRLRHEPVLLLLDNFEQVTTAAGAMAGLMEACPRLKLLVTSREALHLRGEQLVPVPPLSLPTAVGARQSADELSHFEAIQLFVERARAVRPGFALTDDNAAAVVEICRRVDGLPLAIELATARMNLFSPAALRDRLASRLGTLDAGARDLPARQHTLRATIDWSYRLLEPSEQRMFEFLSIFSGISVEAVERIADDIDDPEAPTMASLAALASLVDKSLLRPSDSGDTEFAMLETIREYASERLAERPRLREAAERAHAWHFSRFAERKLSDATGQQGEAAVVAMAGEIENLRIAWRYWVAARDLDELNHLVEGLLLVYYAEGRYQLADEVTTELLDVLEASPNSPDRALQEITLRTSHARTLMAIKGYTGEVEEAYSRALQLFEGQGDHPQIFPILRDLARFYMYGADFEAAARIGEQILRLAESQDDAGMSLDGHLMVANSLMNVGALGRALEQLDQGIKAFESPRYRARRFRAGTDPRVSCLAASGFVSWFVGFPDRGVERANRAVALGAQVDPYSHAYGLFHSGLLHLWRSEPQSAATRADELLKLVADHDFPIWRALGTSLAGAATSFLGRPTEGLTQLEEGMGQYQGMRSPPVFWPFLRFMQAACLAAAGRVAEALAVFDEILALIQELSPAALFSLAKGDLLMAVGDPGGAEESYRRSLELARRMGGLMVQLQAEIRLYRLRRSRGELDDGAALSAVYDQFTEGFGTRDLREAAELLGGVSLSSPQS